VDGTFKMAPKFFKQVVTVAAPYQNKYFVCACMLLPKKDQLTYEAVFGELKSLLLKEKGIINLKVRNPLHKSIKFKFFIKCIDGFL
jgi:hypothetical protein